MGQVEIAGSYYELGLSYGRIVAENTLDWWWKQPTESALALVKACEREIAVHAPGLLEEIRGIADACESNYDLVLANMTVSYWELSACNVIAVSGNQCRHGKTIFARNHDWLDEDLEWVTCFRTHVSSGLPHIGFGFADVARSGGVNREGLAISSAALWVDERKDRSSIDTKSASRPGTTSTKARLTLDTAKRLCSDHEIGLCDHGETRSEPFGTIYSWVAELGTGEVHVAHGRPCENEYQVITLAAS